MKLHNTSPKVSVKVVVLGTGSIGTRHIQAARRNVAIEPIAVSVRSTVETLSRKEGVLTYPSLEQAIKTGAKFTIIATDTHRHASDAFDAINAGTHVLVEKPMGITAKEARSIVKEGKSKSRKVWVGCCLRFSHSLRRFKSLLPRLGVIHYVRVECQSYLPEWRPQRDFRSSYSAKKEEGGVLRDLIHDIDYCGWIFGWPKVVTAHIAVKRHLEIDAEEAADIFWETPRGLSVSFRLDYLSRPHRRRMTAFGEKGTLTWDAVKQSVTLEPTRGKRTVFVERQSADDLLFEQLTAFIGGGVHSPLASGIDGIKALSVIDAARESAKTKRPVRVDA